MNAAEVNEIERSSAHDEHRLKITRLSCPRILGGGAVADLCEIVKLTALACQLELTDAHQLVLHRGGVRQQIGMVGDVASLTQLLLGELGLNGKYL